MIKKYTIKFITNDNILDMFWLLNINCNAIEIKAIVDVNFKHAFDFPIQWHWVFGVRNREH